MAKKEGNHPLFELDFSLWTNDSSKMVSETLEEEIKISPKMDSPI